MIILSDKDTSITLETSLSANHSVRVQGNGLEVTCQLEIRDFSELKEFLQKVHKGARWWNSKVEWQSDDQRLAFTFEKDGWVDVILIPMMPEESPWVLQLILHPGPSCLSDAISQIENLN